jgi:MOSC domain-containing protein YiiM
MQFLVEAVNVSASKGTPKHEVAEIECLAGYGIRGDAHAGDPLRQVSLLAGEAVDRLRARGLTLAAGAFGENIVTRGVDWAKTRVGGLIVIGMAELEITQIGKECHAPCAIFYSAGECIMPWEGIFTRVRRGGVIHAQDRGDYRIGPGLAR